jgi:hypothetical protein
VDDIVIGGRFNGPEGSANGGYAGGVVARLLGGGAAEVRLRLPPPLDRPLAWDGTRLLDGEAVVAEGAAAGPGGGPPADLPAPVPVDEAESASRRFPGFAAHPYPTCFGCGHHREPGDGLRLSPGPVARRDVVAAPWVPHPSLIAGGGEVPLEVMWAALDCAGGWAGLPRHEGMFVLGTMRAAVGAPAAVGDPHVAMGWEIGIDGRKLQCGSALTTADGTVLGWSHQTWIRIA